MTAPTADSHKRRSYETALEQIEAQLGRDLANRERLFERARLLTLLGRDDEALQAYLALLRREPTHFGALTNLASLSLATGHRSAALTAYRQAVACHPDNPAGLVNLANMLAAEDEPSDAISLYRRALTADPDHPQAHQGLGQALFAQGDIEAAQRHWRIGFVGHSIVTRPYRGKATAIRILVLASPRDGNVPTMLMLDDRLFAITTLFPEYHDLSAPLPPHDLLFNAIGDADLCAEALKSAVCLTARTHAPVVNAPQAVLRTGRQSNARRFSQTSGVIAPRISTYAKAQLLADCAADALVAAGFVFPLLLRPPGFQTGLHFARVDAAEALPSVAGKMPDGDVFAIEYLDTAGNDGVIRKYRVMMIDDVLYPLHMAGSHAWNIHYFSSEMANRADLRREEEMFLNDMPASLGNTAMAALRTICKELALDYAGIDFGLSRDGRLVFFEANATMIIYPPPEDPIWDYRRAALDRALEAARKLLVARATPQRNRESDLR